MTEKELTQSNKPAAENKIGVMPVFDLDNGMVPIIAYNYVVICMQM